MLFAAFNCQHLMLSCLKNFSQASLVNVRLQITTGGYRTKHDQAIRTELIGEFTHIKHAQAGKTSSPMNSVRIA